MAEIKTKYATKANITITVAGLTNTSMRESTAIDNSTNLYLTALVGGFLKTGTGSAGDDYIEIFAYGSADGGTTYSGGATGTDAAFTNSPNGDKENLVRLGVIRAEAASSTFEFGPFNVANAFGGVLPQYWGIVIANESDSTLDATGGNHEIHYMGITETVA